MDSGQTHEVVIRRTADGWRVGQDPGADAADLTSAMVLADLLAGEFPPRDRPARPAGDLDALAAARLAVRQLEHALASRVVIEQAIGVLAERAGVSPRDAFEQMRKVARSRGERVHELSRRVVESVTDPAAVLPVELPSRPA